MTTKPSHSPTPWHVECRKGEPSEILSGNIFLAEMSVGSEQDAEFIVRAVNSFEELLSIANNRLKELNPSGGIGGCLSMFEMDYREISRIIAKAEGK